MEIGEALKQLRKEKRNFVQTVDLIINLKNFDYKRENVNFYVELPYGKGKPTKIGLIVEKESKELSTFKDVCDVLEWKEIEALSDAEFKKKAKTYDYFITTAKLVPLIAKRFGKILGSMKKMPDPKLGAILTELDLEKIKNIVEKIEKIIKVTNDKNSIKLSIGKENMEERKIIENFNSVYQELIKKLPKGEGNIKEVLIKLTMSKPIKLK